MSLRRTISFSASLAVLGMAAAMVSVPTTSARAEEGMWTFDNFPIQAVNTAYGTRLDQKWLDSVRESAVRLQGCSASFVSGEGLILTNHHCVVSCIQDLSSAENDYVKNGWVTANREEEKTCPGQTAEVLTEIVDVTDRVLGAGAGLEGGAFVRARSSEIEKIQKEACGDDTKRTCQVISFYRGGQYKLYKFKKYDDVRLVFAPEFQAAFFGGDPDNFNFPRYALDAAFLRAYEDGKPVTSPVHLKWNADAPKEGDPVFVAGNPGTTQRLLTVSQLAQLRDQQLPVTLIQSSELRGRLGEYATTSEEARRVTVDPLFGLENSFKVFYGQVGALTDPAFFGKKVAEEAELRERVAADPALVERIGNPWADMDAVVATQRRLYLPYRQLEAAAGQRSSLYSYARSIVRASKERAKAADQRRAGYSDADIAAMGRRLSTEVPIANDVERIALSFWLTKTREYLTADHPQVKALIGAENPEELATRLVEGTRLADPAFRAQALSMTPEQIAASDDALLKFVLANDDAAQAVRAQYEAEVSAPSSRAAEKIAQARFAVYGTNLYPDATFSLRLSYGSVKGWTEGDKTITPFTNIGGLYERQTGASPYDASERFMAARDRVNNNAVYNFVSTNDIIGGNSGSPVINAKGEVIGAAFDGNIHSLGGSFGYDGELNRTVTVSTSAITEALRTVYNQPHLLRELGVRR